MRTLVLVAALTPATNVAAAPRVRFEPTDLELEDPGVVDVDVQVGAFDGRPARPRVLDTELDIGLRDDIELDLDFALYRARDDDGELTTGDPLWVSAKIGLWDGVDAETHRGFALGVQAGPRVHLVESPRGAGYEGLVLLGRMWPALQIVVNAGAIYDAPTTQTPHRSIGFELGVDGVQPLGTAWSIVWELAAVRQVTDDPHQLYATFGFARDFGDRLTVSAIGYYGFVREGDRVGFLLGVSPKLRAF